MSLARTRSVGFKATDDEFEELHLIADAFGMKLSQYLRLVALQPQKFIEIVNEEHLRSLNAASKLMEDRLTKLRKVLDIINA